MNIGSNEITAIPVLLEQLDCKKAIIAIDVMGRHAAIAKQICAAQEDDS
ncbi:hypothetical protein L3556_02210 [Candidatus Synechococcus calcipolaris G9]|uniref:Transposase n=1 Tax=Candidatus Synechococcus calcipolaris G9 TaxID=1497997 RepID=A0ABT6EVB5_9SYNE|nr:hypothetical protein [Candidatus Synechococcus calcipolaris]MDG2989754.1 hypothetical protein [Candidatus Synechococcus calcipolaris G9]